jgi:hypothetical protein
MVLSKQQAVCLTGRASCRGWQLLSWLVAVMQASRAGSGHERAKIDLKFHFMRETLRQYVGPSSTQNSIYCPAQPESMGHCHDMLKISRIFYPSGAWPAAQGDVAGGVHWRV